MTKLFILISFPFLLSINNNPESILDNANRNYISGNYEEAFSLINMYANSIGKSNLSTRAKVLGEKIYYFYLQSLIIYNNDDLDLVKDVISVNNYFPSQRIKKLISGDIKQESVEEINSGDLIEDDKLEAILEATKDMSEEELRFFLKESLIGNQNRGINSQSNTVYILIVFSLIIPISLLIIVIRTRRRNKKLIDSIVKAPTMTDGKITDFYKESIEYGNKVDKITGRRNNSLNTGELIFKISRKKGLSEDVSYLNYIISHIYDIGLLKVDKTLLKKKKLNKDEFEEIKKHVHLGMGMVGFVPDMYKDIVLDCIRFHHENLDGTGYPSGVKEIPFLARAIRVVESYLSQVSSREYNLIRDKEVAISNLRSELDIFDQDIVELLYQVV